MSSTLSALEPRLPRKPHHHRLRAGIILAAISMVLPFTPLLVPHWDPVALLALPLAIIAGLLVREPEADVRG